MTKINRTLFVCIALGAITIYKYNTARIRDNSPANAENFAVVFDLGGVLIDTHKWNTVWSIGPLLLLNDWRTQKKPLQERFLKCLSLVDSPVGNVYGARDDQGNALANIFCDYMAGSISSQEALNTITTAFKKHNEWFTHPSEQLLMTRMAKMIFSPDRFVRTRELSKDGIKLVKEFKKRGFKVYVLSNWDAESFALLKEENPQFFSLFDDIFISGEVGALKPHADAFGPITSQLNPSHTVFIDDQKENIATAQTLGINTIWCAPTKKGKPHFTCIKNKVYNLFYELIDHAGASDTPVQEESLRPRAL